MNIEELKARYMPSKELIKEVTKEIKESEKSKPKKQRMTLTKNDYLTFAITRRWQKVSKKELPTLYKDISEFIFEKISEKYKVTDIERGDGYFIFNFGDNSVVHFRIKKLPGWKFGMWFSYNPKSKDKILCEWFCQQDLWIDKFKPSRSTIGGEIKINVADFIDQLLKNENNFWWYGDEILNSLNYMVKYRWLASYRDYTGADFNERYVTKRFAKRYMKKAKREEIKRVKAETKLRDKLSQKVFSSLKKEINNQYSYKIIDKNTDGWICSPRYDIQVFVPVNTTKKQCNEIENNCYDLITKTQNKIVAKKAYKEHCIYDEVSPYVSIEFAGSKNNVQ